LIIESFQKREYSYWEVKTEAYLNGLREKIDEVLSIRMKREFDSLNVSAPAAIIIYRMGYGIE